MINLRIERTAYGRHITVIKDGLKWQSLPYATRAQINTANDWLWRMGYLKGTL